MVVLPEGAVGDGAPTAEPLTNPRSNPYVGPRSFQRGEAMYGRERETLRLLDLLIAERIVLLYSPSGAGKTSLIEAALTPALEREGFFIYPPLRVSLRADEAAIAAAGNPYLRSLLLSLEESRPVSAQRPLAELAQLSLDEYLTAYPPAANPVFIFDQFEEILTVDPLNQAARHEFFRQVGAALRNRQRWALFAMREEFLAGLDPYVRPIPTRFANTFRLELLDERAALQAIQAPAQQAGVEFTQEAAERLVDDLRVVRVQNIDNTVTETVGPFIEPVQLQVVCRRLWAGLAPDDEQIELADVEAVGDVDTALREYYATSVRTVAAETGQRERTIRDWFDQKLITQQGLRNQILQRTDSSEGLANHAITPLIDAHLVRAEHRRNATWLELAHDRLIEPVRADNAAWRAAHLSLLQQQAALWEQAGRPDGLLLGAAELAAAESWLAAQADGLETHEQAFLAACQEARRRAQRDRQFLVGLAALTILSIIAFVVALVFYATAQRNWKRAEAAQAATARQLSIARSRQIAASAQNRLLANEPQQALLLTIAATRHLTETAEATTVLRAALHDWRRAISLTNHQAPLSGLFFSPDRRLLATISNDATARLWSLDGDLLPRSTASVILQHDGLVSGLVFSPDSRRVATASRGDKRQGWIWDVVADKPLYLLPHEDEVRSIRLAPDGRTLATRSAQTVRLWDFVTGAPITTTRPLRAEGDVRDFAFSPDGGALLAGSGDVTAWLWELPSGRAIRFPGYEGAVNGVGFSADGQYIYTKDAIGLISYATPWRDEHLDIARIFGPADGQPAGVGAFTRLNLKRARGEGNFSVVSFSPDSRLLVAGADDGSVRLWRLEKPEEAPTFLPGHTEQITGLAFSRDGRLLATTSLDDSVRLWRMDTLTQQALLSTQINNGRAPTFSPDGRYLLTADEMGTIVYWRTDSGGALATLQTNLNPTRSLAVINDPTSEKIVAVGEDGRINLWQPSTGASWRYHAGAMRLDAVAATADGAFLAVGSSDGMIYLLNSADGEILRSWPAHPNGVRALHFLPDGEQLISGGGEATIRRWQWRTGIAAGELLGHTNDVNALALNQAGTTLYSASADGTVRAWDWAQGIATGQFTTTKPLLALAVSADEHWVAAGGYDQRVVVWLRQGAAISVTFLAHLGTVRTLAFAADNHLISGDETGAVRLWNLAGREEIRLATHGANWVTGLGLSRDGRLLYSLGDDGYLRAWPLLTGDLLTFACQRAGRELSQDEWTAFFAEAPYPEPGLCQQVLAGATQSLPTLFSATAPTPATGEESARLPVIHYFESRAGSIVPRGEAVQLRWSVDGATAVYLEYDGEPHGKIGNSAEAFSLEKTTTFRLVAENGPAVRSQTLIVAVEP